MFFSLSFQVARSRRERKLTGATGVGDIAKAHLTESRGEWHAGTALSTDGIIRRLALDGVVVEVDASPVVALKKCCCRGHGGVSGKEGGGKDGELELHLDWFCEKFCS